MSIDIFKGTIGIRKGLAQANRFRVILPSDILGNPTDSVDLSILAKTVILPGQQMATTEYSTNPKLKKYPYAKINDDVQMTFHMTNDAFVKRYFDRWQDLVINNNHTINYRSNYVRQMSIDHLDKNDNVIYSVTLKNAFPVTVDSMQLGVESADTISECSVTIAYDSFIVNDI